MSVCFVFSGTSEGREVCMALADKNVKCIAFVATEYGSIVMPTHENIEVRIGRLDAEQIADLINGEEPDYVVDATHPHAEIITENIIAACEKAGTKEKYIRVLRDMNTDTDEYSDTIISVDSSIGAIEELNNVSYDCNDRIMLTTGVKELHYFCEDELLKSRIIARILPGKESIEEAYRCGVSSKQIVAMEGPFSEEMNYALINQFNVKVLVTKNSGSRGGFLEKIRACKACGIKAIVIEQKQGEMKGLSPAKVVDLIRKTPDKEEQNYCFNDSDKCIGNRYISKTDSFRSDSTENKKVFLIGTGVCKKEYLTERAFGKITNAQLIIGAKRMAEFGRSLNSSAEIICEYAGDKVREIIRNSDKKRIAVLFSGDTGLCSGTDSVQNSLATLDDVDVEVIPGISSVSYFASKIGIQYSDYTFVNLHGKECDCSSIINESGRFIAICSGVSDIKKVVELKNKYPGIKILAGYNLGMNSEEIINVSDLESTNSLEEGLYVICVSID